MTNRTWVVALALLPLAGCSNLYEGKYDFTEGWRRGEILEITSIAALRSPNYYTCVRAIPPAARGAQKMAIVSWRQTGRSSRHAVEVAPGEDWQVGQKVYVNVERCRDALVPRTPDQHGARNFFIARRTMP